MSIAEEFFEKSVDLSYLEREMGYEFRDRSLLKTALTHVSMTDRGRENSYQRMEFLGDSIVGFLISERLYRDNPQDEPGELTNKKHVTVSNQAFSAKGRQLGLKKFICIQSHHDISNKMLADVYEAIIAAIYLDGGIRPASDFVGRTCKWKQSQVTAHFNAVGKLQEWGHSKKNIVLSYSQGEERTQPSQRLQIFESGQVIFDETGKGVNKKQAKKAIAMMALDKLRIL